MNGFRHWPGLLISAFFAVGLLGVAVQSSFDEVRLALGGKHGLAEVVRTTYDTRDSQAIVRLLPPAPAATATLLDRRGNPPVGSVIDVTYLPHHPGVTRQVGAWALWSTVVPLALGLIMLAVAIDAGIFIRRRSSEPTAPNA